MKKYPFYEVDASVYQSEKYNNARTQEMSLTIGHRTVFNPFLAFVLTEEHIPAVRYNADPSMARGLNLNDRREVIPKMRPDGDGMTRGEFTLGAEFNQSYVDGYLRGEKDFHLMALHNTKVYLTEQYDKEWSVYESKVPIKISHEVVEEYGYYAAHIAGVQNLGLIKAYSPKNLTALQYAALLWYNGIKTLSSGNKYQEIKNLKAQYTFCESSEKKIFDQHSVWRDGNYRAGKGFNNQARAYVAGVYSILEPFDLSDREEYYTDIEAFRRNAPIKKT
ncbi:MAG TPA: hypothetical protein PKM59_09985 [Thermodesulfobacteriota bacterium]|nr:hypothetical protein [Thermodesulfobacteriota bacterium]